MSDVKEQCVCGHQRTKHREGKFQCTHKGYNPSTHDDWPCGCRSFKEAPKMTKPIRPDEIAIQQQRSTPPVVFEAVNELIAENWQGGRAEIKQDAIIKRIIAKDSSIERHSMFERGYLNFEEAYRAEGWKVVHDKPGYNETYGAFFVFTKP